MSYQTTILADSPVSYWRLNDTGTTAADLGSGAQTATLNGTITKSQGPAVAGDPTAASMTFDGSTGYLSLASYAGYDLQTLTTEAWVYPATGSILGGVIEKSQGGGSNSEWLFFIEVGNVKLRIVQVTTSTQFTANGATSLPANVWSHIAGTYDGTTIRVYVNGVEDGTQAAAITLRTGAGVSRIAELAGGAYAWSGRMEEVAVYSGALSAAKVLSHYQAGTYPFSTVTVAASSN